MLLTDRELWLLNFFRNSELHGALLMGRLARTLSGTELLANLTRHCATEAVHAALLSELIQELGGDLVPGIAPIQEYYSHDGGMPKELIDLLVLSETLEHRVLASYQEHLKGATVHSRTRQVLGQILEEEQQHGGNEDAWLEKALRHMPEEEVARSRKKWQEIDRNVAARIYLQLDTMFPKEQSL